MKKQVVLVSAFITSRGRVLLLKRSKSDPLSSGIWELPSGTVEFGESPDEAVEREIHEETGLRINGDRPYYIASYVRKHNKLLLHTIEISFYVQLDQEAKVNLNPPEHSEYKWASKSSLFHLELGPSAKDIILKGFQHSLANRGRFLSSVTVQNLDWKNEKPG